MKKYLIIGFLILFSLSFKSQALADIAPPTPAYPNTQLNVQVGLGDLTGDYVIIHHFNHFVETYYLVEDTYVSPQGYGADTYFALDKNYFESNGGIDGLFSTSGENGEVFMTPKDSVGFATHIYDLVIAKDDSLLDYAFGERELETAGDSYIKFPFKFDFYIKEGQDDPNCSTGFSDGTKNCKLGEKTLTYSPQQVIGNNIVLVNSENLNQPETSPTEGSVLPQHLPWYVRLWNFIKSLF